MAARFDADDEDFTRTTGLFAMSITSVCIWVKIDVDRNNFSTAWSLDAGGAGSQMLLLQTDSDGVTWTFYDSNQGATTLFAATVGVWYFIAVSYTFGTANIYYAAATDVALTLNSSAHMDTATITTLRLGESSFTGEWLNGSLAAVKIWDGVALTQAEVEAERWQYRPARFANLNSFYPLWDGGAVAEAQRDYSGNGNNLSGGTGSATANGPPIQWARRRSGLWVPTSAAAPPADPFPAGYRETKDLAYMSIAPL